MTLLEWKTSYSVGVPQLDRQHKGLVDLINRLQTADHDGDVMPEVFEALRAYVRDHFRTEEALLERAGYPDLAEHRREHQVFVDWLKAVQSAYGLGGAASLLINDSVVAFLKNWLVSHILVSDKAYAATLAKPQD